MADLIDALTEKPYSFNFFKAVSLLEEHFGLQGIQSIFESGTVTFEPDPSLAFPPNDISAIKSEDQLLRIVCLFMGLVGVSSPLPNYFSEYLFRYSENGTPVYDFIKIFNNRIYTLFYQAWKKYHFLRAFSSKEIDPLSSTVAALGGINAQSLQDPNIRRLLAYAGIMSGTSRSAHGLETLLTSYFGGIPIIVQEFVPKWVPINNVKPLGSGQLGTDTLLGNSVYDIAGKFRIKIGPLNRDLYESFLPGLSNVKNLRTIVSNYMSEPLDYEIVVQLQSIDLIPVQLGANNARIGETASLGTSNAKSEITSNTIECNFC